ncbi:P27 family phage terminase small subunit [Microbacterium dauci]|uniref:P27 family phage terminase small subunit n=1 Tax=Microbacterium dauci TaxID=3048008 RepID=A0ABT6ZAN5_9MICO|nr:P27 family phage terminase small subunit [Microbacterium sp. LX3-4]MDJ1113226.1 P27 family phage terminase small subunit [Microbacterium sp. LX3-4]
MPAPKKLNFDPPDRLTDAEREVWVEMTRRGRMSPTVTPETLETYCSLVVRWRAASAKVESEGLVVDGGDKRGAVVHPALAAERELAEQVRKWSPLFNRTAAARRPGPMVNATRHSIEAAELDKKTEYEGICLAVLTLAWLIDEAQREGLEALQKATYNLIPSYVKGCAELQITPASLPAGVPKKGQPGGKVTKFADAAAERRARAAG